MGGALMMALEEHLENAMRGTKSWMLSLACCVSLAACDRQEPVPEAVPVKAAIELRQASHTPQPGYAEAAYSAALGQGGVVYLAPQPLLRADTGVTVSRATGGDDRPAIALRFDADQARRITEATSQQIGKPIALLGDGQVLTVATVMSPLSGDMQISGLEDEPAQSRIFALLTRTQPDASPRAPAGKTH